MIRKVGTKKEFEDINSGYKRIRENILEGKKSPNIIRKENIKKAIGKNKFQRVKHRENSFEKKKLIRNYYEEGSENNKFQIKKKK